MHVRHADQGAQRSDNELSQAFATTHAHRHVGQGLSNRLLQFSRSFYTYRYHLQYFNESLIKGRYE